MVENTENSEKSSIDLSTSDRASQKPELPEAVLVDGNNELAKVDDSGEEERGKKEQEQQEDKEGEEEGHNQQTEEANGSIKTSKAKEENGAAVSVHEASSKDDETLDEQKEGQNGVDKTTEASNKVAQQQLDASDNLDSLDSSTSDLSDELQSQSDVNDNPDAELPQFTFHRISQLPPSFMKHDPISASYIHEKFFLFATHNGFIHISDNNFQEIRTFRAHRASILSLHTDGEYFASASMDGTVVVGSILNDKDIVAYDFKRPVHAVIIDRQYKVTKSFISGGMSGEVILSTRNWLGQRADTVLETEHGPITSIKCVDDLIIWTNDKGITFYQTSTRTMLLNTPLPKGFNRPDIYWPKYSFPETDRLIVGWNDHVWFYKLTIPQTVQTLQAANFLSTAASSFRIGAVEKSVELESHVHLPDTIIGGISSINDNLIVLNYLAPVEDKSNNSRRPKMKSAPPELQVIDPWTKEELSVDIIEPKDYATLGVNDYHLEKSIGEMVRWFLISPNDAILIKEFSLHDQLEWYIEHKMYQKAWSISEYILPPLERITLGVQQVHEYINSEKWSEAGELLTKVLAHSDDTSKEHQEYIKGEWANFLDLFFEKGHQDQIVDCIPKVYFPNSAVNIDPKIYGKYLEHYLTDWKNIPKFLQLYHDWDHRLLDLRYFQFLLDNTLNSNQNESNNKMPMVDKIRFLFIELCLEIDDPQPAVKHLIIMRDPGTLQFLISNHILGKFVDRLPEILTLELNDEELQYATVDFIREKLTTNIELLASKHREIMPSKIIELNERAGLSVINYLYLEKLSQLDKLLTKDFEDEMVMLYAKFNVSLLYNFLSKHNNYNIDSAIEICEEMHCYKELVYLWGKIGKNKKAVTLIIDKLEDPDLAIQFVATNNDSELWDYLLEYSMDKPKFIKALITAANSSQYFNNMDDPFVLKIDPISIVKRIPERIEIEGLKRALMNITYDNYLELTINKIILQIIQEETLEIGNFYRKERLKGATLEPRQNSKFLKETVIMYSDPAKPLVTETEVVGEGNEWKQVVNEDDNATIDISTKISHLNYIRQKLVLLRLRSENGRT
ncbi:Vacuolar protein sorting-associated protein 41 [Komagataella phaffii CBS 7435]|uniref:Vacuolar membrane protein n=2 Tax=Komagataella phaffii TaxID=460519 RepID=C4R6R3_KOMPG|nr:Vacuolar membrane protein [Komagataella phaffii GS115]AOA65151.1 GQ67_04368T0 [Komagataella phaffii]CAH2451369.1 Vacuolar protein sorting-associated protein 41 [Komagataella phaffii CBS 7435]AOA69812.1 GQ68_04340T0 [Komagataella phaffii GS115]CAY71288.1 Vacuolar membrane protein [Komagataella phaffii GS115]CCA41105.1 Vacuolar protein sorting-associated protein 41 [Komagataella phaffii CBS 7435]